MVYLVVFPEDTRSSDGHLLPFKRGGLLLAVKTQTPSVPVTIVGSRAILPKGDWRVRSGQIEVTVSAPVAVENHWPGALRGLSVHIQEFIKSNLLSASQPMKTTDRATSYDAGQVAREETTL